MVIAPLITTPYVGRVLHADGMGIYGFTNSIAVAFTLFASLGANNYGQREIAFYQSDKEKRSRIFWEIILLRSITTLIALAVYIGFIIIYPNYSVYFWGQIFLIIGIAIDTSWLFAGMEDFKTIAVRNIFVKVVTVVAVFCFVRKQEDLLIYILINSVFTVVSYVIFIVKIKEFIIFVPLRDLSFIRHLRGCLEFFVPVIATQLYSHLDKIMLGFMIVDKNESGYYEQARKIVNVVILVLTSINAVMYPRIANLYKEGNKEQIKDYYRFTMRFLIIILLPVVFGLFIVSSDFTVWFFGEEYKFVSKLICLSCPLLVFMTLGNFVGVQYLTPMEKQNKMSIIYVTSAVINLILNFFLIGNLLSIGAMIASIIAEAFSCMAQLYLFMKSEYRFNMLKGTHNYFIATIIMAVVTMLTRWLIYSKVSLTVLVIVQIIFGAVAYFCVLALFKDEMVMKLFEFVKKKLVH
ncbi:Membrane protein involved in the export of O-antigen and teichoic acid [Lachnospiraceae bacterium NE2001]|nr:Membrane protein involved in the export of O-antigen and teichoic acid [Lachnospiraceae bacterium NE2001]